jgi:hypothetical protein
MGGQPEIAGMGYIEGAPLLKALKEATAALFDLLPPAIYSEHHELNPLWAAVRLVRSADLFSWDRFKQCGEYETITYLDYKKEAQRIAELKREISSLIRARAKLAELDRDELKEYKTEIIKLSGSFLRKTVSLQLPAAPYPETVFKPESGTTVVDGRLHVKTKWRAQDIYVWLSCPSRILHAEEISATRQWLDERTAEEKAKLRDVESSWSSHPILFISHRWETAAHPDPHGHQLEKLRELKDCLLIYDYSSFPQDRTSNEFRTVIENMTRLIDNVVVLSSPDYMERGWCLYEYLVASLRVTIVCDEVNDPNFVDLRRWSATHAPINLSLKGHSSDSKIQNTISKEILEAVNRIRPKYVQSHFTVPDDQRHVTNLLVDHLYTALPARREYPSPYLGEWVNKAWTREEIATAFTEQMGGDELKWNEFDSINMRPRHLDVPLTIEQAVRRKYAVDRPGPMDELDSISRTFEGLFTSKKLGRSRPEDV